MVPAWASPERIQRVPVWRDRESAVVPPSASRSAANWGSSPRYPSAERGGPRRDLWTVSTDANMDGVANEDYWNPKQLPMPTNVPMSEYAYSDQFMEHNRAINTQSLQPGLLSMQQTSEPINGNLGISFTPQLQPLISQPGMQRRLDPLLADEEISGLSGMRDRGPPPQPRVRLSDIYDPRFTGYGDPYRGYEDRMTGRPKWYYGDIDTYKTPGYIGRSEVDHMDFEQGYGPLMEEYAGEEGSMGDLGSTERPWSELGDLRGKVEERYLADDIRFRTSMMESLMRKRNSEMWQRRVAPLSQSAHTSGFKGGRR